MVTYLFSLTLLISAFLLFWLEPLIAKILLPVFGGVPAVWNTCMVFFQASLLLGYAYVFLSTRYLSLRRQVLVHVCLVSIALLFLPITAHVTAPAFSINYPAFWLFSFLFLTIGVPFLMVSATAPLLQSWYGKLNISHRDPYFLYSASNLGSMLALLAFPLLLEPQLHLQQQNLWWQNSFWALLGLLVVCGIYSWRNQSVVQEINITSDSTTLITPHFLLRLRWILWAFVPASLLLSVTTYLTLDVASIPLLWIIPLALYIASFIIVFSRHPLFSHRAMLRWQPRVLLIFVAFPVIYDYLQVSHLDLLRVLVYLLTFFIIAMTCHGELVKSRPKVQYLAEFYLWIALGGVLGSTFNVFVAPFLFKNYWELPLVIGLACFLRIQKTKLITSDWLLPLLLLFSFLAIKHSFLQRFFDVFYALMVVLVFSQYHRRLCFALSYSLLLFIASGLSYSSNMNAVFQQRNFFGILKVFNYNNQHVLMNGNTIHGIQNLDKNKAREISSYYWPLGPLFNNLDKTFRYRGLQAGIIGLGAGEMACYARPQDKFTFYEINPAVVKIAYDPRLFSFLSLCAPKAPVVLGDARLSLQQAKAQQYDLIILDAFNSDSIPVHLLTLEAVKLYQQKLTPDGIILFHISNRYLNLRPVLQGIAQTLHWYALQLDINNPLLSDQKDKNEDKYYSTDWIAITKSTQSLTALEKSGWQLLSVDSNAPLWRDDFSNIVSVLE